MQNRLLPETLFAIYTVYENGSETSMEVFTSMEDRRLRLIERVNDLDENNYNDFNTENLAEILEDLLHKYHFNPTVYLEDLKLIPGAWISVDRG